MVITFIDGVYTVNAESKDSTELIKEMSLAINMLANENNEDYTETQNDRQRLFVNQNHGEKFQLPRCNQKTEGSRPPCLYQSTLLSIISVLPFSPIFINTSSSASYSQKPVSPL